MFAIMNIKTGKFVYGTNYNYVPPRQRTSKNKMLTYADLEEVEQAFKNRGCGNDYRIVVLKTIEVKRIIERNNKKNNV
jgi:hypothetical protein